MSFFLTNRQRNILVWGHIGQGNVGDELMFPAVIEYAQSTLNAKSVVVISGENHTERHLLLKDNKIIFKPRNPASILHAMTRTDTLLLAGGTYIANTGRNRKLKSGAIRHIVILLLAKAMGLRIVMIGIGFGACEDPVGRICLKTLARIANQTITRDFNSLKIAKSYSFKNLSRAKDLALKYDVASYSGPMHGLGIAPMNLILSSDFDPTQNKRVVAFFVETIERWLNTSSEHIYIFDFFSSDRDHGDTGICEEIKIIFSRESRVHFTPSRGDPENIINEMRHLKFVITMRYHAQVLAELLNVPQLNIAYHAKNISHTSDNPNPKTFQSKVADLLHAPQNLHDFVREIGL